MFSLLVSIVWLASNNQGYVLIVRSPYRLQFSFNFLLILIVLGFLLLHFFLRFIHFLRRVPANKLRKKEAQWLKSGNIALIEVISAIKENDLIKAEQAAKKANALIKNMQLESFIQWLASRNNMR